MRRYFILTLFVLLCSSILQLKAQHTIGISTGIGSASFRPYPDQETQSVSGGSLYSFSWRYYSAQHNVGAIGVDIEYMQRGFAFVQNSAAVSMGADELIYTRKINSIMVPLIWQPYAYFFNNHLRVMLEAAATFSYDISSTYENEWAQTNNAEDWEGTYEYKTARDNRLGYGLMAGFGASYLIGRYEIMCRARYYFGYSDVVRSRSQYSGNDIDGSENPFWDTPQRSPLDNLTISVGVNYRLGKDDGFKVWSQKRVKREKINDGFNYIDSKSILKKDDSSNDKNNPNNKR